MPLISTSGLQGRCSLSDYNKRGCHLLSVSGALILLLLGTMVGTRQKTRNWTRTGQMLAAFQMFVRVSLSLFPESSTRFRRGGWIQYICYIIFKIEICLQYQKGIYHKVLF